MNKSAKEMFEELGYELVKDSKSQNIANWEIIYETKNDCFGRKAQFRFDEDSVYAQLYEDNKKIGGCFIGKKQLQAINQQCKELGWLDD